MRKSSRSTEKSLWYRERDATIVRMYFEEGLSIPQIMERKNFSEGVIKNAILDKKKKDGTFQGKTSAQKYLEAEIRKANTDRFRMSFELLLRDLEITIDQTEFSFMETRNFRFDYAWVKERIAIELEGGIFSKGRHVQPVTYTRDCVKYSWASILGWKLIRITTPMLDDGSARQLLFAVFKVDQTEWKNGV